MLHGLEHQINVFFHFCLVIVVKGTDEEGRSLSLVIVSLVSQFQLNASLNDVVDFDEVLEFDVAGLVYFQRPVLLDELLENRVEPPVKLNLLLELWLLWIQNLSNMRPFIARNQTL